MVTKLGLTVEEISILISFMFFIICAVFIFLFGFISVKHIEREMAKENVEAPAWDKGIGGRYMMYAVAIAIRRKQVNLLIDIEAVKKHSREIDRKLAVGLCISSFLWLSSIFIIYFLFA